MVLVNATAGINLVEGRLFADYKTRLCVYTCPADFGLQGKYVIIQALMEIIQLIRVCRDVLRHLLVMLILLIDFV